MMENKNEMKKNEKESVKYDEAAEKEFFKLKDAAEQAIFELKQLLEKQEMDTAEKAHDIADISDMLDELERDIAERFKKRQGLKKEKTDERY